MDTIVCSKCATVIPSHKEYFFCPTCMEQIRCKTCGVLLVSGAVGCISCGAPKIGTQTSSAVNRIEFEQKGNSKSFVANFTDHVGESLVASLGGLFGGSALKVVANQNPSNGQRIFQVASRSTKEAPYEEVQIVESNDRDLNSALAKIFENDGEKLSLINSRVKQTGKKDHAIRITLLLLYANSLTGRNQTKRSALVEVLNSAAVYDNNFIGWLSKCDEVKKAPNDFLELNLPGRDAAIEILKEFVDPSIEKGNVVFSSSKYKNSKRPKPKADKLDNGENSKTGVKAAAKSQSSSKISPAKMLDILIKENYFSNRRRIPEIIKYSKDVKGQTLQSGPLSVALLRKIKNNGLKREQNATDNQYEYFQ